MDKAQAYAVLRIEPGCTQEEIKKGVCSAVQTISSRGISGRISTDS